MAQTLTKIATEPEIPQAEQETEKPLRVMANISRTHTLQYLLAIGLDPKVVYEVLEVKNQKHPTSTTSYLVKNSRGREVVYSESCFRII